MKLAYYPGCTLKTKAQNLDRSAMAALEALGVEALELPRWNCCGAVFSLADDDLIHHLAPVRNLIRTMESGCDTLVTLCSQCYNTLARANLLMREDAEKRDTINRFMTEEPDYAGEIEVQHYLSFLRDSVGWEKLRAAVEVPLEGLKVAPFYGCTLLRPNEVAIDGGPSPRLFDEFLAALGAEPTRFSAATECCGSYQCLIHADAESERAAEVLASAERAAADALALSCPLCEYNLGTRQGAVLEGREGLAPLPTYYFSQLLALALGLDPELCRFDLNQPPALQLVQERDFVSSS